MRIAIIRPTTMIRGYQARKMNDGDPKVVNPISFGIWEFI